MDHIDQTSTLRQASPSAETMSKLQHMMTNSVGVASKITSSQATVTIRGLPTDK